MTGPRPTPRDAALVVPPSAASRDDIRAWITNRAPSTMSRTAGRLDARSVVDRFGWVAVEGTEAFWEEEGAGVLTDAVSAMFGSVWASLAPVMVSIQGTDRGLRFLLGWEGHSPARLEGKVRAHLPGADVRRVTLDGAGSDRISAQPVRLRCATELVGRARDRLAPPSTPLLEHLARLRLSGWSLTSHLAPIPIDVVSARQDRCAALSASLRASVTRTVQRNPAENWTEVDAAAEELAALIDAEVRVCDEALRSGAFLASTWLNVSDAEVADDVVSTIVAIANGDAPLGESSDNRSSIPWAAPFPLRSMPPRLDGTTYCTVITSTQAASLLQPPVHDVEGLPSRPFARFDEHVDGPGIVRAVRLATTARGQHVDVPLSDLTGHTLMTGRTGSAKSSALASLLVQVRAHGVPVLVVEPTKDEFRRLPIPDLRVWRVGDPQSPWQPQLNLLRVPGGVPVPTHIGLVTGLMQTALDLFDPLPAILVEGMNAVYQDRGWNLVDGTNLGLAGDEPLVWPTLSELLEACLVAIGEKHYDSRVDADLRAALTVRVGALTAGPMGRSFDTDGGIDISELTSGAVVVNFDAVGTTNEKAFLAGLFLTLVTEHLRRSPLGDLRLLIAVEEAHRLLPADPGTPSGPGDGSGAASRRATVELIANMLAECRALGAGVVIVDQSAATLDRSALVNTTTKVALAAGDGVDKATLQSAMNLSDGQAERLTTLSVGEAIILREGMDRPVLAALLQRRIPRPPHDPGFTMVDAVRPGATDRRAEALAELLVRTTGDEARRARAALYAHLRDLLPDHVGGPVVEATAAVAVERVVDRLGRTRRWSQAARRRASTAAILGMDGPEHPVQLLQDGTWRERSCSVVCPNGGCLVGELTATTAAKVAGDPQLSIEAVHAGPARLAAVVANATQDLFDPGPIRFPTDPDGHMVTIPESLVRLTTRCVTGRAFSPLASGPVMERLLDVASRRSA